LRGALPLACLWWFVWGMPLLEHGVAGAPDLATFYEALDGMHQPGIGLFFGAIAALWLAGLLVATEHAEGTIEFLDALPTSRSRVFAVKVATGLLVLWSGPVLQLAIALGFDALSRSSADTVSRLAFAAPWLALVSLQLTVLFAVSLALTFLRRFAWLAATLLALAFVLATKITPAAHVFDVSALTDPVPEGETLAIPWRHVLALTPVAAACLVLSWQLFCGLGDRLLAFGERLTESMAGRAAVAATVVVSVALWIIVPAVFLADSDDEPERDEHGVVYVSWAHSRAATERYSFTYPTSASGRARELLARADGIHERVRAWFGAAPLPRIEVDATEAGAHYAGRAFHETVQMDLATARSVDDAAAVLGHETAHLFIDAVGDRVFENTFDWTRCLHEGLASYVEYAFFRSAEELAASRRRAALAHAWGRIDFEDLVDDVALRAKRDELLVYAAGELLMASLVDVHGDAAPPALVRAFGRSDRPTGLGGIDLWRDAFQAAGFDLEAVANRFAERLDEEKARCAELVAVLPRPRGRVTEDRGDDGTKWVGVTPDLDFALPAGWEMDVQFRRAADDDATLEALTAEEREGTWWVMRKDVPGRRVGFRIALRSDALEAIVWTDWQDATLSR
jgi:hypothetical protein